MVSIPVADFGLDGMTTGAALKLLPAIAKMNPQVVVVELGGHDFLQGHSRQETKENLEKIVDACRAIGAEVILMEIPRGLITDRFRGLERELARQQGLELIPDTAIRRLVLSSAIAPPGSWLPSAWHLSDDGLHPNPQGSQMLARCVRDALVRLYGPDVLAEN